MQFDYKMANSYFHYKDVNPLNARVWIATMLEPPSKQKTM